MLFVLLFIHKISCIKIGKIFLIFVLNDSTVGNSFLTQTADHNKQNSQNVRLRKTARRFHFIKIRIKPASRGHSVLLGDIYPNHEWTRKQTIQPSSNHITCLKALSHRAKTTANTFFDLCRIFSDLLCFFSLSLSLLFGLKGPLHCVNRIPETFNLVFPRIFLHVLPLLSLLSL